MVAVVVVVVIIVAVVAVAAAVAAPAAVVVIVLSVLGVLCYFLLVIVDVAAADAVCRALQGPVKSHLLGLRPRSHGSTLCGQERKSVQLEA